MTATRMSASQQNARLTRDLREHGRAHMRLRPGARDELAELIDAALILLDPLPDAIVDVATTVREELDPKLLEIARETRGKQAFPVIGRDEAGHLLLRPIQAERLAEQRIGLGCLQLIEALARG